MEKIKRISKLTEYQTFVSCASLIADYQGIKFQTLLNQVHKIDYTKRIDRLEFKFRYYNSFYLVIATENQGIYTPMQIFLNDADITTNVFESLYLTSSCEEHQNKILNSKKQILCEEEGEEGVAVDADQDSVSHEEESECDCDTALYPNEYAEL